MRRILGSTLVIALLVSLALHMGAWTGMLFSKMNKPKPMQTIEVVVLDQLPTNQPQSQKLQIVEQPDKSLNDEIPEDAQYLSKNNQRVVKETRAQQTGDFKNTAGKGAEGKNTAPPAEQKSKAVVAKDTRGQLPSLSDLRPSFNPTAMNQAQKENGQGGAASQTNDYLKDTPSELETLLNTREFVYYTYYQRIRSQIRQYWEPSIRQKVKKIFASGRSIASEKDHVTRVVIILNKNGQLEGVQIVGESGVRDLDDAAVEAFRSAEPFPNPPKGIIESDGMIRINWDFILEA